MRTSKHISAMDYKIVTMSVLICFQSSEGLRHLLLHCSHISICRLAIISIYCKNNINK